jgi:diguanylate cyclase (GGDEF)-like protein/PAS domain S-box-containing protein
VHQLRQEVCRKRHREKAVRDRRAERTRFRALGVDVDPLVVERRLGELVDLILGDRHPVGHAQIGPDGAEQLPRRGEVGRHAGDAIRLCAADVDASPMAGVSPFVAPRGDDANAASEPLDVRDPSVLRALADAVAILGPDLRPRIMLGRLGAYVDAGFSRIGDLDVRLVDWVHHDDQRVVFDGLNRSRALPGVDVEIRVRAHNEHDGWHDMTLVFCNLVDHPDIRGTVVRAVDQTVFDREARWRTLFGASPIGIFEVDLDERCTLVNPAFERLTGLPAQDALGHGWSAVIPPEDIRRLGVAGDGETGKDAPACEVRISLPDGTPRWASLRSVPLRGADGRVTGHLRTLEDVTDRKVLEEQLEHDATHDRLTGLGSRALLLEELSAALARTRRGGAGVALLFIDLDGFKRVNDMLGHASGDDLLVQVADRLRGTLRGGDLCVRLGGDEFVVCCNGSDDAGRDARGGVSGYAARIAERVLDALHQPYDIHGHEMVVGASIGIASSTGEDLISAEQLLSNADVAAYRAKRMGRGRTEIFDDELRRQLARTRRIGRSVGRLIDQPRLPLLCAPLAKLDDRSIVGFDCSVDWDTAGIHEEVATIESVVEEAGMSRGLDVAVVRTVLAHLGDWELRPPGAIVPGLGITLTRAGALSSALPEIVRDLLARADVPAALCWLGIPEAAVAQDLEAATSVAEGLLDLGLGVGLRDFGSAVSSLEQLRLLPTPTMTIAGPLVAAARTACAPGDASTALLAAIVAYARALGRVVVAIDLQDDDHVSRLRELGCTFGTGPAFGRAIRPDQVEAFLAE